MNKSVSILYFLPIIFLLACQTNDKKEKGNQSSPEKNISTAYIIQKAIEYSGKNKIKDNKVIFQFRDKTYISERICDQFKLTRVDSSKNIKDVYYKDEIKREIKGQPVQLADSTAANIRSSINSVHYFVHLPYRLKDSAVKTEKLNDDTINDKEYYQLQVKFREKGGGEDHKDIYHYWFNKGNFSMDYLAYRFYTNDGGIRFRERRNEKRLDGVVFQDYNNFKPLSKDLKLSELSEAYQNNQLEKVSEIITTPISVTPSQHDCD